MQKPHKKNARKSGKRVKTRKTIQTSKHIRKNTCKNAKPGPNFFQPMWILGFFWSPGISPKIRISITAPTWDDRGGRKKKKLTQKNIKLLESCLITVIRGSP